MGEVEQTNHIPVYSSSQNHLQSVTMTYYSAKIKTLQDSPTVRINFILISSSW